MPDESPGRAVAGVSACAWPLQAASSEHKASEPSEGRQRKRWLDKADLRKQKAGGPTRSRGGSEVSQFARLQSAGLLPAKAFSRP